MDDRTCTAADASGHGNAGAYARQPELAGSLVSAARNPSAHFDGNNEQIKFPPSRYPSPVKAITFEAWVRPDDVPTSPYAAWQLVTKWNTALLVLRGGQNPRFVFALAEAHDPSYKPRVTSNVAVKPETTYHVVGTYDGTQIRLYVNGAPAGAMSYGGGLLDPNYGGALVFKGWGTLPSPHFQGSMDEVAIYGHALSPSRIEAHYRAGTAAAGR